MVQWVYKRMTIEGFMVGTLAEARELMPLVHAGKIKPTPMKEEPDGGLEPNGPRKARPDRRNSPLQQSWLRPFAKKYDAQVAIEPNPSDGTCIGSRLARRITPSASIRPAGCQSRSCNVLIECT